MLEKVGAGDLDAALESYSRFETSAFHIPDSQLKLSESCFGPIESHYDSTILLAYETINNALRDIILADLDQIKWPKPEKTFSDQCESAIIKSLKVKPPKSIDTSSLLPFTCLIKHYKVSFNYHFGGKRKTNQIEKVEILVLILAGNVFEFYSKGY